MGMVTSVTLYRHPWRSKPCTVTAAAANPGPLLKRTFSSAHGKCYHVPPRADVPHKARNDGRCPLCGCCKV